MTKEKDFFDYDLESTCDDVLSEDKDMIQRIADEIELEKKRQIAILKIKDSLPYFQQLQDKAYQEKDDILYAFATGVMYLVKRFDSMIDGKKDNEKDQIISLFDEYQQKSDVSSSDIDALFKVCRTVNVRQFDIDIHEELKSRFVHASICDFLGLVNFGNRFL